MFPKQSPAGELPEAKVYFSSIPKPGETLTQYSIDDLRSFLRNIELSRGLAALGYMSAMFWKQGTPVRWVENEVFTEWQFAFLAQELVRVASEFGFLRLDEPTVVHRAMHLANGLTDHFQHHLDAPDDERRDFGRSFRYRVANEQYGCQSKAKYWIPRYLSIFDNLARVERREGEPDLNAEFESEIGMPILDFIRVGFGVLTFVTQVRPNFFPENLTRSRAEPWRSVMTPENVSRFLAATAMTIEEYRDALNAIDALPIGMERSRINPLVRRPVVRTNLGFIVPSVWLLVQRITSGIYFDFLDRRVGDERAIKTYGALVGRLFEAHVHAELATAFEPGELLREQEYRVGKQTWRTPDLTLVEGTNAALFEVKTSRVTKAERERAEMPLIRRRLREEIIPAIKRLPEKAAHIRGRVDGLSAWPDVDDFEYVIVTLDPWWPEALTRELIAEELAGTPYADVRYHLMWTEQLEHLGSYKSKTTIFDMLRRRWSSPSDKETRAFLYQEADRLGLQTHSPRLDALFDRFFRDWVAEDSLE